MTRLLLRAYAKVNLSLEVLGRRDDGYHELRTVLQTVGLWDELELSATATEGFSTLAPAGWDVPTGPENLAVRARTAYEAALRAAGVTPRPTALHLTKAVPAAAGLGGGSSDAAAVVRALDVLQPLALSPTVRDAVLAGLGSDVPFFRRGGTQLAAGRGELLQPLPDLVPTWLVLILPPPGRGEKTRRLFQLLSPADFGDGQAAEALAVDLRASRRPDPAGLMNSFSRAADAAFPGLAEVRRRLERRCGHALLSGAGPAVFALAENERDARAAADDLAAEHLPAIALCTVSAAASTMVWTGDEPASAGVIERSVTG